MSDLQGVRFELDPEIERTFRRRRREQRRQQNQMDNMSRLPQGPEDPTNPPVESFAAAKPSAGEK